MNEAPLGFLFAFLFLLLMCSAFFSSSETSMMAINRYRLRHKARSGNKAAIRTSKLLDRTDRLIGVVLIGNNFVNILASSIAAVVSVRLWGDAGIVISTIVLTLVVLIFGEVMPKTLAALHPERVAFSASLVLKPLLTLLYPLVVITNGVSNILLKLFFGVSTKKADPDQLNQEELRTVVHESGEVISKKNKGMLLGVLDLETVAVNDIMIPRNEIVGIDLNESLNSVLKKLMSSKHTRLPVYRGNVNEIEGMLHMRSIARLLSKKEPTMKELTAEISKPYFVPENTPLHTQLVNFQKTKQRSALVVDEYGDVIGLVTLEDILEEIVGDFTTDEGHSHNDFQYQSDGKWLLDGAVTLHDVNKNLNWDLPQEGPKTLNGLITEHLEEIPEAPVCLIINGYKMEILEVEENRAKQVRVIPKKKQDQSAAELTTISSD